MTEEKEYRTCRRCGRPFIPAKQNQEYGEKCLRKMAGQTMLLDRYVVPPRKKRIKKPKNVSQEEDAVRSYLAAVII